MVKLIRRTTSPNSEEMLSVFALVQKSGLQHILTGDFRHALEVEYGGIFFSILFFGLAFFFRGSTLLFAGEEILLIFLLLGWGRSSMAIGGFCVFFILSGGIRFLPRFT